MGEENKNNKNNKSVTIGIIVVIIMAIIGGGAFFLNSYLTNRDLEQPGQELGYDIFIGDPDLPVTTSVDEGRDLKDELSKINTTYIDAKAWLKVPGTSIDGPIFQSTDNSTYYRNDRDTIETKWGENFLDYRNNIKELSKSMMNIIIYGHNTETDNRFTPLLNYKKQEFYNTHKYIEFATEDGVHTYEIFSVYSTDTKFYYIDTVFENESEYSDFVASLAKKSRYSTGVEISVSDSILTLSTCDYSIKNGRFVVQAKLVK